MAKKRALLVGINDYPSAPLGGCVNDVHAMAEYLQVHEGFRSKDIKLLTDGRATKAAIMKELGALIRGAAAGDTLLFHYSGHGVQMPSYSDAGEVDGLDECFCPVNFAWTEETTIRDNEMAALLEQLPEGANFTWVSDSCHSADLQRDLRRPTDIVRTIAPPTDIAWALNSARAIAPTNRSASTPGLLIAGCQSDQTSADAVLGPNGERFGALTWHLLAELRKDSVAAVSAIVHRVREAMRGRFSQVPQLEGDEEAKQRPFLDSRTRDIEAPTDFWNDAKTGGAIEIAAMFDRSVDRALPGDLVGSGYVADGPGAKIRYEVEPTDNDKTTFVLRLSANLTWWKSLEIFIDVNGQWVSGGRRIEVRDDIKEASIDIYWWEPTTGMRVEFWKAGFLNFGSHVLTRHMNRDSNRGKRITFTWERD